MSSSSTDQIFFASIPPYKSRCKLSPPTVDRCLTHWTAALHTLLHLPDDSFKNQFTETSPFTKFLSSYISNDDLSHTITTTTDDGDWVYPSPHSTATTTTQQEAITTKTKYINRCLRLCLKRGLKLGIPPSTILQTSRSYIKLGALFFLEGGAKPLLRSIWGYDQTLVVNAVKENLGYISTMLRDLAGGKEVASAENIGVLQEMCYFLMVLPEVAVEVLAEEVVVEDFAAAYFSLSSSQKGKGDNNMVTKLLEEIRRLQFTIIMASMQTEPKRYSTIIDFLFNFVAGAETDIPRNEYITAIISQTPLLDRLAVVDAEGFTNRWSTVVTKLQGFDNSNSASSKRISRLPRRRQKVKQAAPSGSTITNAEKLQELAVLFPDREKSVLEHTLAVSNYDLETATMSLLDDIPLDHTGAATTTTSSSSSTLPTKPASADELSTLTVPSTRLYMGKRDIQKTADNLLQDRSQAPTKSQILSALQAFDSDDDERDDTYDHEDVGGTVEPTNTVESEASNNIAQGGTEEKALYTALVQNPGVFARDAVTRRSNERKALREVTGMSDEALEGWKIMLERDGGKRLRQLEIRYSRESSDGTQNTVQRTAYRKGDEDDGEEGGSGGSSRGGRGGYRGGRGGRRFAGPNDRNVAGQQKDHAAVTNTDGKEPYVGKKTSKARGEHNRKMQSAARDRQRTKKMGKGMGGGM
ncbi:hypothetical protein TWF730_010344 [Orbilia blumenaviensis]|uniref:CUE domain-containing protein n=1 Tax=Orbilia blumenaviensis TaxID=1796055 RepID=A0AAV9UNZ4_9PEZI